MANPENTGRATISDVMNFKRAVVQGNPASWSTEAIASAGIEIKNADMNLLPGEKLNPTETELE